DRHARARLAHAEPRRPARVRRRRQDRLGLRLSLHGREGRDARRAHHRRRQDRRDALMLHEAPQVLVALEQSGLAAAIRQSVWAYPAANVGHILALTLFAGAVAAMDARLLGAFAAAPPASVVRPARRAAMLGLLLMLATGSVLFAAEASHVAMNPVIQL